ncbi:MAG: thiamine ABC transporter substrate-binding protein [Propionibacteriaceae bacterium]|jgi:thiamine transport system substrate-binding protein|nr:thiamine ABC transporter substrate-binding protein [Propionibacteriaceae bacterium]
MKKHMAALAAASLAVAGLMLGACSADETSPAASTASTTPTAGTTLTVITHDSFELPDELVSAFEAQTGIDVTFIAPGNAGTIVNQLILTKDSPLGDVVFGIDNTFAGRAISNGVLQPYASPNLPTDAATTAALADGIGSLTPIDWGDVCLNADVAWYGERSLAIPATLDDLVKPEYANQLVVTNPATSSPGLAFLAATVGAKGEDGYLAYWQELADNGVRVSASWTDAYTVEFSGSSGKGAYPLVLSYASSPMYEVGDSGESATVTIPGACFRQVEYAGIVAGASNPLGAQLFIDWLLTAEVQSAIPDEMYMTPVSPAATLPAEWGKYVNVVTAPIWVSPALIEANRETWIQDWTEIVLG